MLCPDVKWVKVERERSVSFQRTKKICRHSYSNAVGCKKKTHRQMLRNFIFVLLPRATSTIFWLNSFYFCHDFKNVIIDLFLLS